MRHFVLPGIHALARANGRVLHEEDIKPSARDVRPASVCDYPEAGMLYAVCASILRKSDTTREVALGLCRNIGKPGDAKFIYELDSQKRVKELSEGYEGVEGADVLHSFVLNSVKTLKRRTHKQATVVYPGRDVWCWEVLSRKLGQPSIFDSRVSRDVAGHEEALKKAMADWAVPDWNRTILFDSGYAGTVPRAIGKAAGLQNINVLMLSAMKSEEQIFPSHAKARRKALACEYLAKYQKRSVVRDGAPYQELADLQEFIKAALLTIWLWHHVSPARLPSWKDRPAPKEKTYISTGPIPTINVGSSGAWQSGNTSIYSPIQNYPIYNASITSGGTGGSGVTGSVIDFWGNTSTSAVGAYQLPMINPNTLQLVTPNSGSLGGPAAGAAITPTTGRLRVVPIPPVTDGNGKPISI
jgi:hypothetical protein